MNPFEARATDYDAWFDTSRGRTIFEAEGFCLRPLVNPSSAPWLEVGVGTGRFAQALGVTYGLDPSSAMLRLAAHRGVRVCQGVGEHLPYARGVFGGVLIVTTLCFVSGPEQVLREAERVLPPGGRLVLGIIPADSAWGRMYAEKGRGGHPVWNQARLLTVPQAGEMAVAAGFTPGETWSTLMREPDEEQDALDPLLGVAVGAGFVAIGFTARRPVPPAVYTR